MTILRKPLELLAIATTRPTKVLLSSGFLGTQQVTLLTCPTEYDVTMKIFVSTSLGDEVYIERFIRLATERRSGFR